MPLTEKIPECCKPKRGIKEGFLAGALPHIGCFAIILFAILGTTIANSFFKRFFFNYYYLPIIFALSLGIATFSAFLYIKKFSDKSIKRHWKYLAVLYSSVIIINLLMIYLIFPYTSNISLNSNTISERSKILNLDFDIPCSGHAPLVISELKKVDGIENVKFISGKSFEIIYDPEKINKEQILKQDICKEFNAKE